MRKVERVINSITISLLEITVYDEEDIAALKKARSETNFLLGMDMLPYLDYFEKADYIVLTGGNLPPEGYDPLYCIHPRALVVDYENTEADDEKIDLAQCEGLEYLFTRSQLNCINYAACSSLKTLVVFQWNATDLTPLCGSLIDSLGIIHGRLISLDYIDQLGELKVLYLCYLKQLRDLSAIKNNKTLKKIWIENCNKAHLLELFESESLNILMISGNNLINSLYDLRKLPHLTQLLLDNCFIADGDLECMKTLQHAALFPNRKNYSVKDSELPKVKTPYRLKDIPQWRQLTP